MLHLIVKMSETNNNIETLLAFDVGLKRTGVASGQTQTKTAQVAGLLHVKNGKFDWLEVDKLILKWEPNRIIIGDPKTDDPHLNKAINRLKSYIQQNHKLPIIDVDETLSSVTANNELTKSKLNVDRKIELRDQLAACLILETYFSSLS